MLASLGFAVERAPDGVVASQRLATSRFDAVLSEVFLPALSGIELLRYAKEHDADLPVLLMTGAPDIETASQAVELGAHGFTSVVLEYLKAVFEVFGGTGGGRRAD